MKLRSNEPFWLVKNGILKSYPSLKSNLNTDILIVGGGITGSLIAHQCISDGYNVVLLDRREVGNGSTSATTAMLQYEIDVPLYKLAAMIGEEAAVKNYRACSDAIDKLVKIARKIKSDCGFEKKESLFFGAYKKDVAWLKKEFETRKKHGFPVTWLEKDEIQKKFGIKHTYGGILSKQGGNIDAFRFTHDVLAYNAKKGLKVYDKTDSYKVIYKRNGVLVHTKTGFKIKAKKLIYCNGYESTEIIKEKFVDLLSTYAMVGEQMEESQSKLDHCLFWNTADPYIYMRTTEDNRLLIGGGDEDFVNTEKRDELIGKKVNSLHRYLKKILPEYEFTPDFAWAGTFGETKDGLPYIGEHGDFKNTYFVLGFGGNGITFSIIGMQVISDLLKGNKNELTEYYRFGR